jgi:hypothetical protein
MKRSIAISKRHHGPEHTITKGIEHLLSFRKTQFVALLSTGLVFEAIGYEDDQYVVRGPSEVAEERMQTIRADPTDVILRSDGAPVICHGLQNDDAYLNGKIGDIRSYDETTGWYGVYFEDKAIEPKNVKPQNLRILFDVPDN